MRHYLWLMFLIRCTKHDMQQQRQAVGKKNDANKMHWGH